MDKYDSPSAIAAYRSPFWRARDEQCWKSPESVNICSTSTNFPFLPINNVQQWGGWPFRGAKYGIYQTRQVGLDWCEVCCWSSHWSWNCTRSSTNSREMGWKCEKCDVDLECRIFITAKKRLFDNFVLAVMKHIMTKLAWPLSFGCTTFNHNLLSLPDVLHPCSISVSINANALQCRR